MGSPLPVGLPPQQDEVPGVPGGGGGIENLTSSQRGLGRIDLRPRALLQTRGFSNLCDMHVFARNPSRRPSQPPDDFLPGTCRLRPFRFDLSELGGGGVQDCTRVGGMAGVECHRQGPPPSSRVPAGLREGRPAHTHVHWCFSVASPWQRGCPCTRAALQRRKKAAAQNRTPAQATRAELVGSCFVYWLRIAHVPWQCGRELGALAHVPWQRARPHTRTALQRIRKPAAMAAPCTHAALRRVHKQVCNVRIEGVGGHEGDNTLKAPRPRQASR